MSTQFEIDWSLFLAARSGDVKIGAEMLDRGANPNFVEPVNKRRPSLQPSSVLVRAAGYGNTDFVEILLNSGALIPITAEERRRLSYAARCADSPDTLLLLFARGLSPIREDADWAQEKGYSHVLDVANQELGYYEIIYDIDELLTLDVQRFFSDYYSYVPGHHSVHEHMLIAEERVLRDLWEFCVDTGSGFTSMISNEHFDTVERAHKALTKIGDSVAGKAVEELVAIMAKSGFPPDPAGALKHLTRISEKQGAKFETEIEALEQKYLSGDKELSLWYNLDYLERGMEFARANIEKLRRRKKTG